MGWGYATIVDCADAWFDEYKEYVEKNVTAITYMDTRDMPKYNLSITNGHFTAMVNANTNKLGCGRAKSQSYVVYVCNYYPPGNIFTKRRFGLGRQHAKPHFLPAYQIVRLVF